MTERILDKIQQPGGVKNLRPDEYRQLAAEIRALLVDTVTRSGGHLASNLGVVELTIALHAVFDIEQDKIVWDVGHQSYVHKILSGRLDSFHSLRQADGISGFPKREESPYDAFNTGHSSTSISVALGIARARDIRGEKFRVVAVTGDGALTGGMCYEAMNDAGHTANDLLVILNDNTMSISGNVGSVSRHLSKISSRPVYFSLRDDIHSSLERIPLIGKPFASFVSKIKSIIKYALIPGVLFEELGFRYIGPVDGHDIDDLKKILSGVASMHGPVLVHVLTKKGKGYREAEDNPQKFHSVAPVVNNVVAPAKNNVVAPAKNNVVAPATNNAVAPVTNNVVTLAVKSTSASAEGDDSCAKTGFSQVFGAELTKMAAADPSIVAISAAMTEGTGLDIFETELPDRFFDVGIAEQHALTLAAGMSLYGLKPVVALYSTFLQRAYDQVLHDICLQNAHVVIAVDRAGIVGEDGETHQGLYDMAFLRQMPNIVIMAPSCDAELRDMLIFAVYGLRGPVAIRYPKGIYINDIIRNKISRLNGGRVNTPSPLASKRGEQLLAGEDITVVTAGTMLDAALDATEGLLKRGYSVDLISARFIKPLDENLILKSINKTGRLLVAEDGSLAGGFGGSIAEILAGSGCATRYCGLPDAPVTQGRRADVLRKYGLDGAGLLAASLELLEGRAYPDTYQDSRPQPYPDSRPDVAVVFRHKKMEVSQ